MIEQQTLSRRFKWAVVRPVGGTHHWWASCWRGFSTSKGAAARRPLSTCDLVTRTARIGFIFGAVSGLIIASLQWSVLNSWTPNARLWILLNAVGFGLVHAMNDAVPYQPLSLPLNLVIVGIIVGLATNHRAAPCAFHGLLMGACGCLRLVLGLPIGICLAECEWYR